MIKKYLLFLFSIPVILILLGHWVPFFRFDVINGSNGSTNLSSSISESKKRKAFIGRLELVSNSVNDFEDEGLFFDHGWVEKQWYGGVWFYTTNISSGYNVRFKFENIDKIKGNIYIERKDSFTREMFWEIESQTFYGTVNYIGKDSLINLRAKIEGENVGEIIFKILPQCR